MKHLMIVVWLFLALPAAAEEYDAAVTVGSESYLTSVEVENGEVTRAFSPDGNEFSILGAQIDGIEAFGFDDDGQDVQIELEGYSAE